MTEIIDITIPIQPGMVTYPGDPTVTLERVVWRTLSIRD
jgi:kynurenine formamidase